MAIVAANKSYKVFLTATPPNQLRFRLLNADASYKIQLGMYYFTSQRIDLYRNDTFINATNAVYVNGAMQLQDPTPLSSYMPTYSNASGSNLYVKADQMMYFSIDGSSYIDLKIAPVLFLRFGVPAITPDQFFNTATLVGNMAILLGVDPSMIRKVNIVRASSKKKRQAGSSLVYVEVTIMSNPPSSASNSNSSSEIASQLSSLSNNITNKYLTGQLQAQAQSVLNITIAALSITPPVITPSNNTNTQVTLVKVASIVVVQNAAQCQALLPCIQQPSIKVLDGNVNLFYFF
jgi:hypothetical protein